MSKSEIEFANEQSNKMSDLISREILMGEIRGWQEDIHDNEYDANRYDFVFDRIYEIIDEISTVDAVEVVHGHWITHNPNNPFTIYGECSECGFKPDSMRDKFNYCPNCGAKMDEKGV